MAKKPTETPESSPAATPPAATAPEAEARLRQGNAPACPYCSRAASAEAEAVVVLCKSVRSDPYFTRYQCPTKDCPFSAKVPRPQLRDRLRREHEEEGFSARPGK